MSELGYNVYENEDRKYEKEGVTGKISRFMVEKAEYPMLCIDFVDKAPSKAKVLFLSTLFTGSTSFSDKSDIVSNAITVYASMRKDSDIVRTRLGRLLPSQVKSFLKVFAEGEETFEVTGYLTKDKVLEGKLIYVLSE